MVEIAEISNPWRDVLLGMPASWRGVMFHVEQGTRSSGRRAVVHEYPKRNEPYAEDMGLHAVRWQFTGYLIYRPSAPQYDYVSQRTALRAALERDGIGWLIHPVLAPTGVSALCERHSMTETRERGGYTVFEMSFVASGKAGDFNSSANTSSRAAQQADTTGKSAASNLDKKPADN